MALKTAVNSMNTAVCKQSLKLTNNNFQLHVNKRVLIINNPKKYTH